MESQVETTFPPMGNDKKIELTIEDVKLMLSLIEVITKRGGFTPRDFTAVGKIHDKLIKFIE